MSSTHDRIPEHTGTFLRVMVTSGANGTSVSDWLINSINIAKKLENIKIITRMLKRFEGLTAVKVSMLVFWVVMLRELVGRYKRFEGAYCFHLQGFSQVHAAL
jgi:hypothetical protein